MTCLFIKRAPHNSIDRAIETHVEKVNTFLMSHDRIHKVTVAAMHIFRAAMMWSFCAVLPFTPATSFLLGTAASLGYFASIEYGKCTYRFSVLACAGAFAFYLSAPALAIIVNGLALASIKAFVNALLGSIPAILYLISVVWISNASVNDSKAHSCCPQTPAKKPQPSTVIFYEHLPPGAADKDRDDFEYRERDRVPQVHSPRASERPASLLVNDD